MLRLAVLLAYLILNKPIPIVLTGYDPALEGINCAEPCNQTATGYWLTEADYYDGISGIAACPANWLGRTIVIPKLGKFKCLDTGSAIKFTYNSYYDEWVIHIDILVEEPFEQYWNYWIIENYELK